MMKPAQMLALSTSDPLVRYEVVQLIHGFFVAAPLGSKWPCRCRAALLPVYQQALDRLVWCLALVMGALISMVSRASLEVSEANTDQPRSVDNTWPTPHLHSVVDSYPLPPEIRGVLDCMGNHLTHIFKKKRRI